MNFIQYQTQDRIGTIMLNRPDKRNALNFEVVNELKEALTRAEADPDVKVVLLKATGESFCAGADLAYLQDLQRFSYTENLADSEHLKQLFLKIYSLKKIVIAQVEGDAIAGGCGLVTCCDFVFSVPTARFGYTEVKIGFIPAIVMVFLLSKVSPGKARELVLTGDLISANEAHDVGLVNRVCDHESIEAEVFSFAQKMITSNSGNSLAMTKQMLAEIPFMTIEKSLEYAAAMNATARASDDCKTGIAAFLNKNRIKW